MKDEIEEAADLLVLRASDHGGKGGGERAPASRGHPRTNH